jgi:hypothetical protein
MLQRLKDNFQRGIERIKWLATVFSERLKIEITIIKLLYRSDEMGRRKEELLKTIGQYVYESRTNPDKNVFRDKAINEALEEIEKIEKNIGELKQKMHEIGSVGI